MPTRFSQPSDEAPSAEHWRLLTHHAARLRGWTPSDWLHYRTRPDAPNAVLQAGGLRLDHTRQKIDAAAWQALQALAAASPIASWRAAMFAGEPLNSTEGRAVKHWEWRGAIPGAAVAATVARLTAWMARLQSGEFLLSGGDKPQAVIHLGIGGSYLGPLLVAEAIAYCPDRRTGLPVHFVANVDAHELQSVLQTLDPHTTLVTIASKTFGTRETMRNAQSILEWMAAHGVAAPLAHCVALTAAADRALSWGVPASQIFTFDDSVGGRFSVWSPVGLPARIALGELRWQELLRGACAADAHFCDAALPDNLPVVLALLDVWNHSICGLPARIVAPYDARLRWLVGYLQQLEMESLGKRLDLNGRVAVHAACPMIWGEPGTNGQHAYFQWLHQADRPVAVEMLMVARSSHAFDEHQNILLANVLAQADALSYGRRAERGPDGADDYLAAWKDLPGGQPVSLWGMPVLDAYHLGFLLAVYEHKMVCLGALWNINPFDQFGVELGKVMASDVERLLTHGPASTTSVDMAATLHWLDVCRSR
jgi:glucose-6-phosphate isomerase